MCDVFSLGKETMITANWKTIEDAGREGLPVLFPLGVIEEHGPHLPLGSDIYWSVNMCRLVKDKLLSLGRECMIAPPYYWGINHCTGGFPGSFSLRPETMQQVLFETLENLKGFGFTEIYCFSYHGDALHIKTITEAIKRVNEQLGMRVKLVVEAMDLRLHGWKGDEDFLLVSNPSYPLEWFEEQEPSEKGLLDIHAGAFETAVLQHICPKEVDTEMAKTLTSYSLTKDGLQRWLQGGENTRAVVPFGYAGNPAGYEAVGKHVKEMLQLQVEDIAEKILGWERKGNIL